MYGNVCFPADVVPSDVVLMPTGLDTLAAGSPTPLHWHGPCANPDPGQVPSQAVSLQGGCPSFVHRRMFAGLKEALEGRRGERHYGAILSVPGILILDMGCL